MSGRRQDLSRYRYDAVIFDLDGVITDTATVHAAAWKQMFDTYLEARGKREGKDFHPFDDRDYRQYVDGKPRYDGVKSFLSARGIRLPYGAPDDSPNRETVCGLGNRKNALFQKRLEGEGVTVYRSSVDLVRNLRSEGFKVAVVSSSKNCGAILRSAGIEDLFDQKVDGRDLERMGLAGKPAPDIFREAARRLDVVPADSVVVEDAVAGVQAGARGEFGLVVGIDRVGQGKRLLEGGADVVVEDLSELRVNGRNTPPKSNASHLPSALEAIGRIISRIGGQIPAFFFDYDGTLTPIVRQPEDAVLSDAMRQALRRLAAMCTVAVISGRDRNDVRKRVGLTELIYAGSHGFDIAGPGGLSMENQQGIEFFPLLDQAAFELEQRLAHMEGVAVERKKFAIAVHFRQAAEERITDIKQIVADVSGEYPDLGVSRGKKIFEFQPRIDWDKGRAVLWLLSALDLDREEVLPIYIGDDTTDEDAFRALRDKGIGIVVENESRQTTARYALADPGEVQRFLDRLVEQLSA